MKQEFRLQDPGEGIHEVDVLDIMIAEGDEVSEGQEILVVESDKAAVELPSPYAGRIDEIRVNTGETVAVGDVLVIIEDGEDASEEPEESTEGEKTSHATEDEKTSEKASEAKTEEDDRARGESEDEKAETGRGSASAKKRADTPSEEEIEPSGDHAPEQGEAADTEEKDAQSVDDRRAPKASPAARKAAKEAGLDLADIQASGSRGQITVEDVKTASGRGNGKDNGDGDRKSSSEDNFGPVKRRPLSSLRAATARTMARSWKTIPHAVHHDSVDITEVERWRRRQAKDGGDVSLTAIVIKAIATLLPDEPRFNASFDAEAGEIVERHYVNISVAVATEHGLVTPVIVQADRKSASEIHNELVDLAEKARNRRLKKADLSGGTFTVTNVGSLGGRDLVPIINPPQTAILGLARASLQPVVTSDFNDIGSPSLEARMILPVSLSFDHRALDGADAARLAGNFSRLLSDPMTFMLET